MLHNLFVFLVLSAMNMKRTAALVIFVFFIFAAAARAQPQPEEDIQAWNDVQLTLPVGQYVDFNAVIATRFGKNVTRLSDGRFAVGMTLKPSKSFSIQPLFWFIRSRNALSRFRNEHRLNLRLNYRFPFRSFGLSHRSSFESRLRSPLSSWRYRPSVTFEKDIPNSWIPKARFFATEEVFYDSLSKRFSRNRFTLGVNKTLSKQLSVDVYYMRQNDGLSRPGDLHVLGTSWKIKM